MPNILRQSANGVMAPGKIEFWKMGTATHVMAKALALFYSLPNLARAVMELEPVKTLLMTSTRHVSNAMAPAGRILGQVNKPPP